MEKLYYSYDLFVKDTQLLVDKCRDYEPEILLAVARGGLTLAHLMSQAMNIRNLYTKKITKTTKIKFILPNNLFESLSLCSLCTISCFLNINLLLEKILLRK